VNKRKTQGEDRAKKNEQKKGRSRNAARERRNSWREEKPTSVELEHRKEGKKKNEKRKKKEEEGRGRKREREGKEDIDGPIKGKQLGGVLSTQHESGKTKYENKEKVGGGKPILKRWRPSSTGEEKKTWTTHGTGKREAGGFPN